MKNKNQIFRGRGVAEQTSPVLRILVNHHLRNSSTTGLRSSDPIFPIALFKLKPILISVFILSIVLMLAINAGTAGALGVRPAKTDIVFRPGETKTVGFKIVNTDMKEFDVELSLKGDLARYIKVDPITLHFTADEEMKEFSKTITMPSVMPPGTITGDLLITEVVKIGKGPKVYFGEEEIITKTEDDESTITARVAIKHKITVTVPRQEKYVEASIEYREQQEDTNVITEVKNLGLQDVNTLKTETAVMENEQKVADFASDAVPLPSLDTKTFYSSVSKQKAYQGEYELVSTIKYDEKEVEITKTMILGSPEIKILAFDKFFKEKTINEFRIDLENKWNKDLGNVYATIELTKDGQSAIEPTRTISMDIAGRAKKTMNSYLDLTNINEGEYMCKVTVNYNDQKTEETRIVKVMNPADYNKAVSPTNILAIMLGIIAVLIAALLIIFSIYLKNTKRK